MSDNDSGPVHWEYALEHNGTWSSPSASGQDPHRYESREELVRILRIIHPGERVRLMCIEEIVVPES